MFLDFTNTTSQPCLASHFPCPSHNRYKPTNHTIFHRTPYSQCKVFIPPSYFFPEDRVVFPPPSTPSTNPYFINTLKVGREGKKKTHEKEEIRPSIISSIAPQLIGQAPLHRRRNKKMLDFTRPPLNPCPSHARYHSLGITSFDQPVKRNLVASRRPRPSRGATLRRRYELVKSCSRVRILRTSFD